MLTETTENLIREKLQLLFPQSFLFILAFPVLKPFELETHFPLSKIQAATLL